MIDLAHKTDYVAEGISRLLGQFRDKPRFVALVTSWLLEVQALEDAAWELFVTRLLQSGLATGDLLDKVGSLVGQVREGFSDAVYLRLILARIKTNRSNGRRESLITIASLLVPATPIEAREYTGAITITADGPVAVPPYVIAFQFLAVAALAGVRMSFVWYETPTAGTLLFGYRSNGGGGIAQPTAAQSPGFHGAGPLDPHYIAGGAAAGAFTVAGGAA